MNAHDSKVKHACKYFNYKWPPALWTGVMFFEGERITIEEFNHVAKYFKD